MHTRPVTVALIGNPNTGKSTLFGGLVGVRQHVGNYPGVTVEKKTGRMSFAGVNFNLIDLPGLYSLAPRSRDEIVAVDLLVGRSDDLPKVDAVLCIVDGANLERNLYLVSQVLDFGLPTVVAVNMLDIAAERGIKIDLNRLERQLGVPVVSIQANHRVGLGRLKETLARAVKRGEKRGERGERTPLPEVFEAEVARLEADFTEQNEPLPRCLLRRLLLDVNGYLQQTLFEGVRSYSYWTPRLEAARTRLAEAGCAAPGVETAARYRWAAHVLDGVVTQPGQYHVTGSDRIDRVLTHRVWGTLVFAAVMLLVFQSVFVGAQPIMDRIETATESAGRWIESQMDDGAMRSLLVQGVVGGVGGILAFLPQIMILFGFMAVLEDCGYMARCAFLMDRIMVCAGLSGKSFIPLLSSFACTVPGIMASRVIENDRDRLTTILVAPLLTCSARLPVYAMLIAAFIPSQSYFWNLLSLQGLTLAGLYLLGILMAVAAALVLKRTILRGQTPPFVMELPSYKWPSPRTVFFRMFERGWVFMHCAGTIILAVSIVVWAALYYPHNPNVSHQQQQRESFLGQAGQLIEPVVRPLGWDWRIGCAVIASFPARELVVATMGVMYHVDDNPNDENPQQLSSWGDRLRRVTWDGTDRPVFNVPVALSIMVFFALCAQCAPTLAVISRETNSWRWPAFTFAYMTLLAYFGAMFTYQVGMWIGG